MKVLIIEDNSADFLLLVRYLKKNGVSADCQQISSAEDLGKALEQGQWDTVLADYTVPGLTFSQTLADIKKTDPDLPVIVVSGTIGEESAVELLKQGVWDFVVKDRLARLVPAIERAVTDAKVQRKSREAEVLFRNTIETAPYGIVFSDASHQVLLANPQAEKFFGYQPGELINLNIQTLIPVDFKPANERFYQEYSQQFSLQSGSVKKIEIIGVNKAGEKIPIETTLTTQSYQGTLIVTVTLHDIANRMHHEEANKRRTRTLSMLSNVNKTILRNDDELQLVREVCEVVVENRNYRVAWFKYMEDSLATSPLLARQAGFEQLDVDRILQAEEESQSDSSHSATESGQLRIIRNFLIDSSTPHWRMESLKQGYYSSIVLPLKDADGVFGALSICSDHIDAFDNIELPLLKEMASNLSFGIITLRKDIAREKAEAELKASHALLETTIESTAEGIAVFSLSGRLLKYNRNFLELWKLSASFMDQCKREEFIDYVDQLVKRRPRELKRVNRSKSRRDMGREEIELKDGRVIECVEQPHIMDRKVIGHVFSHREITKQKNHESQLAYLANHDALTGLPNRNLFNDRLNQTILSSARSGQNFALFFLDLDRFKLVNDCLGHDYGDLLLIEVARRIPNCVRKGDTVARMGGDEFAVILPNLIHEEDVVAIAMKLLQAIEKPYIINQRDISMGVSVGISLYPKDGVDLPTLLKHADSAMYRCKDSGGNSFRFYTIGMDAQVNRHLKISGLLQHAIERQEFLVYYQPQIEIKSEKIIGAEALIRWRNPALGMVSPTEFIPIAEESNVITNIGTWMINTVFKNCHTWQTSDFTPICIAINLSARQFDFSDLPKMLSEMTHQNGQAFKFEFEITESMVMQYPEKNIENLYKLKEMGFSIAIDDFGTGYSSLAYLKRFPIDKIKIDRSFVRDIPHNQDDVAIARAVIALSHELGLQVVAEGVETQEQFLFLKEHGCDLVQGYYSAPPMPVAELEALIGNKH